MRKLGALITGAVALWLTIPSVGAQQPDRVDVLILFKQRPNQDDGATVQRGGGRVKYVYNIVPAMAVSMPAQALNGLQNNPHVDVVEADGTAYANDIGPAEYAAELANTWGVQKIGAGYAHNLPTPVMGAGVNVAVIDTGINYNHTELLAAYRGGYDFVNGDSDPFDDNGHGTHVSGTIAASRNGVGVVGVAPLVNLYALKVLNAQGSGSYSNIIAAIDWATSHNIQVTNNSYGGSSGSTVMEQAFRNAAAAGVVSVVAAGNSGNATGNTDTVGYPGKYDSVLTVAATNSSDVRANFSSTGPAVKIAAPGVNINSTVKSGGYESNWSGTSMATPHVTGVAALLFSNPATVVDSNANGKIGDEIRNILALTALDLGAPGRDTWYGFGRVRVQEALTSGPVPPVSGVSGIDYATASGRGKDLVVTVSAVYKPIVPDIGATVSVTVTLNGAFYKSASGVTDADGSVSFTFKNAPSGVYSTIVNGISGGGLGFDGATPANSFNKK